MSARGNRRHFGKQVACLAAGALAGETGSAAAAQPKPDARSAALQALTDLVRSRHGAHLSEEQLQHVRRKIAGSLLMADALKRTRLDNGDEPDFVFQAE
ncbi:MAG: hypothetical protein FJ271_06190 [Planctomycetes bacterium]|nr:hypothetical protein [Planctomycetota bacterium]